MIRLLDCSHKSEKYEGTLQTDALYAYTVDNTKKAAIVKDIIDIWRHNRKITEDEAIGLVEWNGKILNPFMQLRDIEVNHKKLPLYSQCLDEPFVLRYWKNPHVK
jgi:hypothetical protein